MRLSSFLFAFSITAAIAGAAPCPAKQGRGEVCIDLQKPVTPLPLNLLPDETLRVKVVNKTPWDKITLDTKLSAVEDETSKQAEQLFRFLTKLGVSLPAFTQPLKMFTADEKNEIPEPFALSFRNLSTEQEFQEGVVSEALSKLSDDGKALRAFMKGAYDPGTFGRNLESHLAGAKSNSVKPAVDLKKAQELLEGAKALMRSERFYALPSSLQQKIVQTLFLPSVERQENLSRGLTEWKEAAANFEIAATILDGVEKDKSNWTEFKDEIPGGKNLKADVDVSAADLRNPDQKPKKIATFSAVWKSPSPLSMSLGFTVSFLTKEDFSLKTVRGDAGPLIAPNLSYQIDSTLTRPVIFPSTLIHYRPYKAGSSDWGFAFSGGAGVDVSGSSPTGELLAGVSVRYGSIYVSPLIHFGRRKSLAEGYKRGETAPSGFVVPTTEKWGRQFGIAITYKLPF